MTVWSRASSVDINPSKPCPLGASRNVASLFDRIDTTLEANIMILSTAQEATVLLISIDALYVGPRFMAEISARTGFPTETIIVIPSHTHQAPMLDETKPGLGLVDDEHFLFVVGAIVSAIIALGHEHGYATNMISSYGQSNHSINRRLMVGGTIMLAPNPDGFRDETISVMLLKNSSGTPIAALWSYGCHPVGYPRSRSVSAHYPGVVRSYIRRRLGALKLPVLFAQGFSANTRPSVTRIPQSGRDIVARLLKGPRFSTMNSATYQFWSRSLARKVGGVMSSADRRYAQAVTGAELFTTSIPFSRIGSPNEAQSSVTAKYLRFLSEDRSVGVLTISAEVPAELGGLFRADAPDDMLFTAGCADATFGYLPLSHWLREGGYEAVGFLGSFSLDSVKKSAVDEVITAVRSLFDDQ